MTIKKTLKTIRELVDAFPEKKTDKDRLRLLSKIKLLVASIEEPLKKRSNQTQSAYDAKTRIIKKALKELLTAFDRIYAKQEEIGDSHVRDQMYAAIYRSFIQPQPGYTLPPKFGMFSDKGNALVRAALQKFLTHPQVLAACKALKTPQDRFAAFQDSDVETSEETTSFEYFGYSNKVRVA
jgi:hypothetical protein